jgi:hypothetical protein
MFVNANVFMNVWGCDPEANFDPFWFFFDCLISNIAGKKVWINHYKVGETITTGKKITITDEAFTVLAIQNYWPSWFGDARGTKTSALWTDSRQGNSQYMGWHADAYTRFDLLCRTIQKQRHSAQSKRLEVVFQRTATEEYATMGGKAKARAECLQPTMKVFNELNDNEVMNVAAV